MEFPSYNNKTDHISKLDHQKVSKGQNILSNQRKLASDFPETSDNKVSYLQKDHIDSLSLSNDKVCFAKKKYLLIVAIGVSAYWIGKRT